MFFYKVTKIITDRESTKKVSSKHITATIYTQRNQLKPTDSDKYTPCNEQPTSFKKQQTPKRNVHRPAIDLQGFCC